MLGKPKKIWRNLSASATCCIFEPGSVMAMKRLPTSFSPTACFTRSKKYCLKIFGSSVLPDLLDTMKIVFARSIRFSMALICAGSVESSTCNSGKPPTVPKVSRITSGHRLEPPMPRSRAWLNPADFTSSGNLLQVLPVAELSLRHPQPAEPFPLVGAGPYRGVTPPEPAYLAILSPVFDRSIHCGGQAVGELEVLPVDFSCHTVLCLRCVEQRAGN